MQTFESKANLEEVTGALPENSEADWGYRLRGEGQPGGKAGGWLVTFVRKDRHTGSLIAYEINSKGAKTGTVILLRDPWTTAQDDQWVSQAQPASWWDPGARNSDVDGEADIRDLDAFLP